MLPLLCLLIFPGSGPTSRDPWLWPFDSDSIWNTSIGSKAVYIPAGLPASNYCAVDRERFFRLKSTDPVRSIYAPTSWGKRWPGNRARVLGTMPLPDDLIIPDGNPPNTPNECCAFLMPDGRSVIQLEPTCRLEKAGPIVGYPRESQDLYGPGIYGTHWGSGLSTLGGSIRLGELTSNEPIHHALKLNPWGEWLYYSKTTPGFRWPADRCDDGAEHDYKGHNPRLMMGSLLAIRPNLTAADLGIKTPVGFKLFQALRDYGAYVTDSSGWNDYDWCAETGVEDEVKAKYGISLVGNSGPYFEDMQRIVTHLSIVDNNAPASIGGGGKRRRPKAPLLKQG